MTSPRPPYIRVYSESPLDDLWIYLRRFEVTDWVRDKFRVPTENAEATGDCVRQAREYFRVARSSGLLTRPVLLYYGMVSLGKLLFLLDSTHAWDMDKIEVLEREGHGLAQHDARQKNTDGYSLEEGKIRVVGVKNRETGTMQPRGVFPRLAELVCPGASTRWLDKRVPIKQLLRAVPQLDLMMVQAFGDKDGYSGLYAEVAGYAIPESQSRDYRLVIDVEANRVTSPREVQQRIPYLDARQYPVTLSEYQPDMRYELRASVGDLAKVIVREELSDHIVTIPPGMLGSRFDSILAHYMLMYGLSIVARYKPNRWARILEGKYSPLLPVLERLMFISERWWPNLLLNRLTSSWVTFASPSYLG
jgi:hypothetical protein